MLIPLTFGGFATIDDEDGIKVQGKSWHITNWGYVYNGSVYLHRLIMGLSKGDGRSVDHIDGDKLNNRKHNLRLCNQSQNNANTKSMKNNCCGYKGVCWDKREKKYRAKIQCHGIQYWLGYFDTSLDAAKAYDDKAKELFGEFARTNDL